MSMFSPSPPSPPSVHLLGGHLATEKELDEQARFWASRPRWIQMIFIGTHLLIWAGVLAMTGFLIYHGICISLGE